MRAIKNENTHYGIPGIGGSLGCCALCGETFLKEMILGKSCKAITSDGFQGTLYAHEKCLNDYNEKNLNLLKLPDKSPLKIEYLRLMEERNECPECNVSLNKDGKCPSCEADRADRADRIREGIEGKC